MKRIIFILLFFSLCVFADTPSYWLLPPDGYVYPGFVGVGLDWKSFKASGTPKYIVDLHVDKVPYAEHVSKHFLAAKIDLNGDGTPEWIVDDNLSYGTGSGTYIIYQQAPDGKYREIGELYGRMLILCEAANGYYQIHSYDRCGMLEQGFDISAYDPQKKKYVNVRSEWHNYITFINTVKSGLKETSPRMKFFSRLETVLRLAMEEESLACQDNIKFETNGFYYSGDKDSFAIFTHSREMPDKPDSKSVIRIMPLERFGFKEQYLYFLGNKKYEVLGVIIAKAFKKVEPRKDISR